MIPEEDYTNSFVRFTHRIRKLLQVPHFNDPHKQRVAEVLHILSSVVLLLGIGIITITPFIFSQPLVGLPITLGIILPIIFIQYLNRRGRVNLAAHIFIYSIWICNTVVIVLSGGFYSSYITSYITISVMGGLILGGTAIIHFSGISILATMLIFLLGSLSLIPDPVIIFNSLALIIINLVGIIVPSLTLYLVIQKYDQNVQELKEKEYSLSLTNQELTWEIKARKEAETLQIQTEKQFKSALMESPIPILLHAEDGEIILVNHAWVEKSGYSTQRLRNLNEWINYCFREEAPQIENVINNLINTHNTKHEGDYPFYTEHGKSLRWHLRLTQLPDLPDGRHLILTMASDMTNFMYVESALRESEENLSRFNLLTNDGIWDWDLKSDAVVFDPLYFTMAGYQVDEFPHQLEEFRKRVHPDDVDKVFKSAEEHLAGKSDIFSEEFRFLRKDGTWLWILGRGKVTEQDENGDPLRFVGTHTDISAQKAVEEELNIHRMQLEDVVEERTQRLNERIEEVERLNLALINILDDYQIANEKLSSMGSNLEETYQELESFTYSVSNDLRKPLMKIQDTTRLLTEKFEGEFDKKTQKELDLVHQNARLMDQLINDLLQLSKLSKTPLNLEETDPSEIIADVIDSYSDEIDDRKIKVETQELQTCLADRELISLVFQSLIHNSIKFTQQETKPSILIGSMPDESHQRVIYFVKDNGVGFNMKDKEKVFDTFQRLHNQKEFEGTGAGLALSKKIVNRHGGNIWAEAEEKKGAVIYFDLAISPNADAPQEKD